MSNSENTTGKYAIIVAVITGVFGLAGILLNYYLQHADISNNDKNSINQNSNDNLSENSTFHSSTQNELENNLEEPIHNTKFSKKSKTYIDEDGLTYHFGYYLITVDSFPHSEAIEHISLIKGLGYDFAVITKMDESEYYEIIIDSFDDLEVARYMEKKVLKDDYSASIVINKYYERINSSYRDLKEIMEKQRGE